MNAWTHRVFAQEKLHRPLSLTSPFPPNMYHFACALVHAPVLSQNWPFEDKVKFQVSESISCYVVALADRIACEGSRLMQYGFNSHFALSRLDLSIWT